MSEPLRGLDLQALRRWLDEEVPGLVGGPLTGTLVAGGKSNLTYIVGDGIREWVVRRPPLGHVLATAHDMAREHRVMTALRDTDVPVPETFALCSDDSVIGSPFYVMQRVHGTPYRTAAELEPLGPERTRTISQGMVDALAVLHEVDPGEVGLADFGRPEGFLERQVRRWKKQLDASHTRDLAGIAELHERLAAHQPTQAPTGIVHGDYRLDNVLTDDRDQPAAVIDWEMATLGDPLTDIGLLVVYQRLGDFGGHAIADAASAPGFLSEEEMLQRYAEGSDRDLSALGFYLGLASFKLAVILEGIHYRYVHGQTVGEGFDEVGALVEPIVAAGLESMKEHS